MVTQVTSRAAAVLAVGALLLGCSGEQGQPGAAPSPTVTTPSTTPSAVPSPLPPALPTVRAVLDGVALELEVADTREERAVGLMRRSSVPPGTGMVFRYDQPSTVRFWMFDVTVPLRAVFVREGVVVSTVVMPPCEADVASACPSYGADGPYDTVVETAPETLPDVAPGDALELSG